MPTVSRSAYDPAPIAGPQAGRLVGLCTVVTGASSGIGRAIAESFALQGASVLITYREAASAARDVAEAITARGGEVLVARADVSNRAECERLASEALDRLGRIDTWVNNAGADVLTGAADAWDWERKLDALLAVDVKGTVACCRAAVKAMRDQPRGGSIINMSWDHVVAGMGGENPELFSAAKGAVLAYSKSLARGAAPQVRVNVLCPGWIETQFAQQVDRAFHRSVAESVPLRRWGTPGDVAAAAVYLASPEGSYLTGQAINVGGGVVM